MLLQSLVAAQYWRAVPTGVPAMTILQIRIRQSGEGEWRMLVPGEPDQCFPAKEVAFRAAYRRCSSEARQGRPVTVLHETADRPMHTRALH